MLGDEGGLLNLGLWVNAIETVKASQNGCLMEVTVFLRRKGRGLGLDEIMIDLMDERQQTSK